MHATQTTHATEVAERAPLAGREAVRAWIDGWVVSRGAAAPVAEPWGFTVDVGQVKQPSRHVLGATGSDVQESDVRKVASSETGADVWLKVFDFPDRVTPWLGPEWWIDPEDGYLMTVPLTTAPSNQLAVPDGYRLRTWSAGGVFRAMVTTADGSWAARGQIAPTGRTAVADQIETSPQHRRKGLGSLVMRTLAVAAVDAGAEIGVLAGTPEGRALYEALGWRVVAGLTSARRKGPEEI